MELIFLEILLSAIITLLVLVLRLLFKMNKSIGRLEGRETINHKRIENVETRVLKIEQHNLE